MKLICHICGQTKILSDVEQEKIRQQLLKRGPAATHVIECEWCGRFQTVLAIRSTIHQQEHANT